MTNLIKRDAVSVGAIVALVAALLMIGVGYANALVTSTMGPGQSGANVTELQTYLSSDSAIYPEGLITGFYGPLTTAAVERFQCKYGIVCSGDVAGTGYGRVGPLTLAKIQSLEGGASTPPSTGGSDVNAPVLSTPAVATTSTSATIHWTTSEPAQSWVLYSRSVPALSAQAFAALPSVADSSLNTSSDVTLTGLLPATRYYYIIESVDVSGNVQYGIDHWFTTNP